MSILPNGPDNSSDVGPSTWIREIQTNNWVLQQSLSRLLGSVVYHLHPASSRQAITCLLALVDQSVGLSLVSILKISESSRVLHTVR